MNKPEIVVARITEAQKLYGFSYIGSLFSINGTFSQGRLTKEMHSALSNAWKEYSTEVTFLLNAEGEPQKITAELEDATRTFFATHSNSTIETILILVDDRATELFLKDRLEHQLLH